MKFNLRNKLMLFTAVIAILPLVVAGQSIIRVARDELKSAANEQLVGTARQLTDEFNAFYEYSLLAPLDLIRNAIGGELLDSQGKITLLKQGIADLPDIVSLQVDVDGMPRPIIISQETYFKKLNDHVAEPLDILRVTQENGKPRGNSFKAVNGIDFIEETGDWLAVASLPIEGGIAGRRATLHARINLDRLKSFVSDHPFNRTGDIHILDTGRNIVFGTSDSIADHSNVIDAAMSMLKSGSATIAVEPFTLDDGAVTLAAIAVPRTFPWAILVEKSEADAYQPVTDMIRKLLQWVAIGLIVAMAGAFLFAMGISRPILKISSAALEIAKGNLNTRVSNVRSRDEIEELANRFNEMIVQLNERFELQKFVSRGTMKAILGNDEREVSLGGERRRVAIMFADIRGYTNFSESREPEEVVEVLNSYFQIISDIVTQHHGDIDKFVGDEIMAVFGEADMTKNAVECAMSIMNSMEKMTSDSGAELRIGIGINTGEVVVGAMGSSQRKDFTVLGDNVNLAARLCSHAGPDETWVSKDVMADLPGDIASLAREIEPVSVKGKANAIDVFVFDGPDY